MKKNILAHTKNLDVSSNEYATKYSMNRILKKLLENDKLLEDFYRTLFKTMSIQEYQKGNTYYYNNVVWFLNEKKEPFILRCIRSKTSSDLYSWKSGESLEDYGWQDLNPDIDILEDYGIQKKIDSWLAKKLRVHQTDVNLSAHPLGQISYGNPNSKLDIENKVANSEMTNLDNKREQIFFPYQTTVLKTSKTSPIIGGYCRKYDNGLLEYDILFRLSYLGPVEVDPDTGLIAEVVDCNTLNLAKNYIDSSYFETKEDTQVFNTANIQSDSYYSEIGEVRQCNRNDYANVYYATLNFAAAASTPEMITTNFYSPNSYMVFSGDITCQNKNLKNSIVSIGSNALTFCSKQSGSITAILVTYPNQNFQINGENAKNGGLASNSFHCQLVGKWN